MRLSSDLELIFIVFCLYFLAYDLQSNAFHINYKFTVIWIDQHYCPLNIRAFPFVTHVQFF